MPEGISVLEELAIRWGAIPVGMAVMGILAYGFCAGESIVKSAYQRKDGDSRPIRELVYENFQRIISPMNSYL